MINHRMLVIDDEQDILDDIQRFASKRGFFVETANNTKDGLEKLLTDEFDVALIDLSMEKPNSGAEIIHEAAQKGINGSLIVMTGHGDHPEIIKQALNDGVMWWFDKPLDLEMVTKKAKELSYLIQPEKIEEFLSILSHKD